MPSPSVACVRVFERQSVERKSGHDEQPRRQQDLFLFRRYPKKNPNETDGMTHTENYVYVTGALAVSSPIPDVNSAVLTCFCSLTILVWCRFLFPLPGRARTTLAAAAAAVAAAAMPAGELEKMHV